MDLDARLRELLEEVLEHDELAEAMRLLQGDLANGARRLQAKLETRLRRLRIYSTVSHDLEWMDPRLVECLEQLREHGSDLPETIEQ